jgi:hypothetical protein
VKEVKIMRSHKLKVSSLVAFIVAGGMASGCYTSTKEVVRVASLPPAVEVPAPVVVAPAPVVDQTTTSTNWDNGTVERKTTTRSIDGTSENQTTTTWNNGETPSQTVTTTTTSP